MPRPIYPAKLQPGDTVAVVAVSDALDTGDKEGIARSTAALEDAGLRVTYGDHVSRVSFKGLNVASRAERVEDFHKAIADTDVKAVIIASGGENGNQILEDIDYKHIKSNPKILCGYSDNTVLLNAIQTKTGLTTYYGPNFGGFGSPKGGQFTHEYVRKCLMWERPFRIEPSKTWYEKDYSHSKPRYKKHRNEGWWTLNSGIAQGALFGGEVSTISLLGGTSFMPKLKDKVLMLEMYQGSLPEFDRYLEWLLMQKGSDAIEGLLIGRFQKNAGVSREGLKDILLEKPRLQGVPIVANVDFGHTNPKVTLPIGGIMTMNVRETTATITISEH